MVILASTLLTICALPAAAAPEDWPRWLGPRGDGISSEKGLAEQWPRGGPKQLWTVKVGGGYASPIAAGGKLYVFSSDAAKDTLHALDAKSGDLVWSQSYDREWRPQYEGTRATPNIEGERIYTFGEAGDLTCRELDGGKEVWRVNIHKQVGASHLGWGATSSPLIVDDLVYVQVGEGGPTAVAVKKDSGEIAWQSEARGKAGYAAIIHADVKDRPQLVVFAGTEVCGVDPKTGKTLWTEPWQTSYDVNAATPVYRDGHLFVSSEYGHGSMMLQLSADGAKKLWESKDVQCRFQPPILEGDSLYANSGGTLKCMSWPDGKIRWELRRTDMGLGVGGTIVRVDGDKMILMSEGGALGLARAAPDGVKLLAKTELIDANQVWATPLVYDGKLYARGVDEMVCVDLRGK